MKAQDIKELFTLQSVLAQVVGSVDADIVSQPDVLAALIAWKHANGSAPTPAPTPEPAPEPEPVAAKPSRAKAKTAEDQQDTDF